MPGPVDRAAHDSAETHFVQQCEGPVFSGHGAGTFACSNCGNPLIQGFDPARFLSIGIRCGGCNHLTTTPQLPQTVAPPFFAIVSDPIAEHRPVSTIVPASAFVIGRTEMARIGRLYAPVTPPNNLYHVTPELLDATVAEHDRCTGTSLPVADADPADPYAGLHDHALAWSIRHLRLRLRQDAWSCLDDVPTPMAVVCVAGFLHFLATWSHHPWFATMLASVAARRFSMHGLAPFAAAHCMAMQGNRIGFAAPSGAPAIDGFNLASGHASQVSVHVDSFDRFEIPFGRPWDQASLRAEVAIRVAAAQSRINLRNPGLLVLSPGAALVGFDGALSDAVNYVLRAEGRKNRGLMAVAPIVLRLQATPDPHAIRFGYGFLPTANRHYAGETVLQTRS